jgi:hypothetical protein
MKYRVILAACLVALIALASDALAAKGGDFGFGNRGFGGTDSYGRSFNDNGFYSGYGGYGGYGQSYGYGYAQPNVNDQAVPYTVQRPIIENPAPCLPIKISNPSTNTATLNYVLNGTSFTIPPGYNQDLACGTYTIDFSRGANLGQAEYSLEQGQTYYFSMTDHGWELYRGAPAK